VATLAHSAAGEFGKRSGAEAGTRAVLERAVDAAPSHIRPPRGRLRSLFARGRSARALIERYRLWPAIEHAYQRITREYGPVRVEISAEDGWGDPYVLMQCYGAVPETDDVFEFQSILWRELWDIVNERSHYRLSVFVYTDPRCSGR
jgi:hypothetical protein